MEKERCSAGSTSRTMAPASLTPVYAKLILVQVLWGGTFVASELALTSQPPLVTAALRFALTSIGYLALLFWKGQLRASFPSWRAPALLTVMGFFGVLSYNVLLYHGLLRSNAASAALLIPTTQPIITVALSALVLREPPGKHLYVGLLFGALGAALVLSGQRALGGGGTVLGSTLIIGAAAAFSAYAVAGKLALQYFTPLQSTSYSTFLGTAMLIPAACLEHGFVVAGAGNRVFWGSMMYLVIFATLLPYLWWNDGIKAIGTSRTAVFTFLMPPVALGLAVILLGHSVGPLQALGGAISLLGVAVSTKVVPMGRRSSKQVPEKS